MNTHRFWFGRFEAHLLPGGGYALRDWLQPKGRTLGPEVFAGLQGRALDVALFQHGFARAAVSSHGVAVAQQLVAGAGPNTLRLWEALAVGAIPVLLGVQSELPVGGSLPEIDWESIVLRVPDEQINTLPELLAAMPLAERRQRQQLGLQAYALVKAQRCF